MSGDPESASAIPSAIGRYKIVAHLASDAADDVYQGFDPMIERPVVVKVFRLRLVEPAAKAAIKQTFYREMQRAGLLMHPAIVTLFDAGELPGGLFMATEFVDAKSLAEMLAAGFDADLPTRVSVVSQMVDALEYARELGIWHLNLKPTHVLISADFTLKLGGFCVAPVVDALVAASSVPTPVTSRYVAPERIRGEQGDQRSDVFSLAQLARDVLTRGLDPASDEDLPPGVAPPLPQALAEQGVDAERWAAVFARALAPDVTGRFDTPAAFRLQLLLALGVGEVEARLAWETSRAEGARTPEQEAADAETILAPSTSRVPHAGEPTAAGHRADQSDQSDPDGPSETMLGFGPDAVTHTGISPSHLHGHHKKGDPHDPDTTRSESPTKPAKG